MIARQRHIKTVLGHLAAYPVVAIVGARQVGKTTLARQIGAEWPEPCTHFDLERPSDLARLRDPELALEPLQGLVILDEIQRLPEIFPLLRVLADRPDSTTRFLVLGSASPQLMRQTSESLAGRIHYHELSGLALDEIDSGRADELWVRGGLPRSFLADDDMASDQWRQDFILTYLERDLPNLGIQLPAGLLRRFWTMLAHNHGQLWNGSRLGAALGVAHTTARSYLDVLRDTYMIRTLPPYFANTGKRQVKSPKIYLRDTGLLHSLLGIRDFVGVTSHPIVGSSWESFAMDQVIREQGASARHCYFWAVHSGAELDLLIENGTQLLGFEFKRTLSPKATRSMNSAVETIGLDRLTVVYPGSESYALAESIDARPLADFN